MAPAHHRRTAVRSVFAPLFSLALALGLFSAAACAPAIDRLGAVIIAGCGDATAARDLGFVPSHGVPAALAMAHGRADGPSRIGFLLSPPYFPLRVGSPS